MEYAVQVETYTLSKANNLVLNWNVQQQQEIDEIVDIGYLNGLFTATGFKAYGQEAATTGAGVGAAGAMGVDALEAVAAGARGGQELAWAPGQARQQRRAPGRQ
ncbi:ATP-citrate synthase beta chain protein 2 [Cinnamomum micranthum f. kanehirae]|uniref:ATP-citrate synthase beta chain protein 2 n=1 Tax=Cinnamomum micranthum f. kanehirae TaxID=337451 RepID=A0A443PWU7_9MAGN|nr:ATP-citrate synthase beta chain protein 2 [Cinnamomum micranthum f. kanehirae]